jgi:hypothetical protein
MSVAEEATVFLGPNAHGKLLVGSITGSYDNADLEDLASSGACKDNGCLDGAGPTGDAGGRANNLPICPVSFMSDNLYITLAGGGLLVADITTTPMSVVGEYGRAVVYGAGCAGVQGGNLMFINGGVSASGA